MEGIKQKWSQNLLEDVEKYQPIHTAKNGKACSGENSKGVAG